MAESVIAFTVSAAQKKIIVLTQEFPKFTVLLNLCRTVCTVLLYLFHRLAMCMVWRISLHVYTIHAIL